MNRIDLLTGMVIVITLGTAIFLYPQLPEQLAVHFGIDGNPDRYQGKLSFLFMYSSLLIMLPFLMKLFKKLDPKSKNYEKFNFAYDVFRLVLTVLLASLLIIVLLFNLGYAINIQLFTLISIGLLFIVLGNYMH